MGGGLMQLVAYGAQDIYLTSNPQITFFKVVYRRHTNFSREVIEQTFSGNAGANKNINVTISRNGDLVHKLYLETPSHEIENASVSAKKFSNPGHSMIDNIVLEIGGQQIDKIYGHWMEVWARLSEKNEYAVTSYPHVNHTKIARFTNHNASTTYPTNASYSDAKHLTVVYPSSRYQEVAGGGGVTCTPPSGHEQLSTNVIKFPEYSIPLPFWFCRNPGLSLPLIALQYHEVKLKIQFSGHVYLDQGTSNSDKIAVWAEYIYLDTPERRRFAQGTHEYLIEQLQRFDGTTPTVSSGSLTNATFDLNFNHPVKELIFCGNFDSEHHGALPGIATKHTQVTLKLNGHDRFSADRRWTYFSKTQILEHHTGAGNLYNGGDEGYPVGKTWEGHPWGDHVARDQIGVYSFALKPEEHQPSGTCNFSRIDSTRLSFKNLYAHSGSIDVVVYAVNYNVLRIMSGMGGLAYSN
jgi:hypothetical protein